MFSKISPRMFLAVIICTTTFTTTSFSCKNPNQVKQVIRFSKPYWDDLVKFATKSGAAKNTLSRYVFTETELLAAKIAFNTRLPIYNSLGQQVSHAFGESSVATTEGNFQQDFYKILDTTLDMLNKKLVFHSSVRSEILTLINNSENLFNNQVSYDAETGYLTISSLTNYTKINYDQILDDATTVGTIGTLTYYIVKKEI